MVPFSDSIRSSFGTALLADGRSIYFAPPADIVGSLIHADPEGQLREPILCRAQLSSASPCSHLHVWAIRRFRNGGSEPCPCLVVRRWVGRRRSPSSRRRTYRQTVSFGISWLLRGRGPPPRMDPNRTVSTPGAKIPCRLHRPRRPDGRYGSDGYQRTWHHGCDGRHQCPYRERRRWLPMVAISGSTNSAPLEVRPARSNRPTSGSPEDG